jgi:hypothetical protein
MAPSNQVEEKVGNDSYEDNKVLAGGEARASISALA